MSRRIGPLAALLFPALLGAQTPPTWRLVEAWRKGGDADGPFAFENVIDLEAMPGGRLIALDRRNARLHIYDSAGAHVRTIGRQGGGPGEFRFPFGVAVAPDGRFAVNDPQASRISLFDASGAYERGISIRRQPDLYFFINFFWDASFDRDGQLLASVGIPPTSPHPNMPGSMNPFSDSTLVTERWARDFSTADTLRYCSAPAPVYSNPNHYALISRGGPGRPPGGAVGWSEIPFTSQRPYSTRDLDGNEWGPGESSGPELVKRRGDRCTSVLARAQLRGARPRIPVTEREQAMESVRDEYRSRVPREYPWYRALRVDDQNNLWVERNVDGGRRFDIFATDGRPLGEALLPAALDTDNANGPARVVIAHGHVFGFVKDADDVPFLVAWRIVR